MASLYIFERKNGINLNQYMQTLSVEEIDKDNCVTIEIIDDNGDQYLIQVPTENFSQFVIQCQKMKAVLS